MDWNCQRSEVVATFRLLALPGYRRGEVLNLRWRDIGEDGLRLDTSKTGPRTVPIGEHARTQIAPLPGVRNPDAFLFPRYAEGQGQYSLAACWRAVCADAVLGRLLGHRRAMPTSPTGTSSRRRSESRLSFKRQCGTITAIYF